MNNKKSKLIARRETTLLAIEAVKRAPCPRSLTDLASKDEWNEEQKRILNTLTDLALNITIG